MIYSVRFGDLMNRSIGSLVYFIADFLFAFLEENIVANKESIPAA